MALAKPVVDHGKVRAVNVFSDEGEALAHLDLARPWPDEADFDADEWVVFAEYLLSAARKKLEERGGT